MEPSSPASHKTRHFARIAAGAVGLLVLTVFFMMSDMSGQQFQSKFTIAPDGTSAQEAKLKTSKKTFMVGEEVSARLDYEGTITNVPCGVEGTNGPVSGAACTLKLEQEKAPHVSWTPLVPGKYRFKIMIDTTAVYSNRFTVKIAPITVPTAIQ